MHAVEKIVVTTIIEGYVDMLLGNEEKATRPSMKHHFDPRTKNPIAENGLSLLLEIYEKDTKYTILFDAGQTPGIIKNNFLAMNVDPTQIDHVVISHGHPDHYGGLVGVLDSIGHPVPVVMHPDSFYPRYIVAASGQVIPFYNHDLIDIKKHENMCLVEVTNPMDVGPGTVISGVVSKGVEFEPPKAQSGKGSRLYQVKDHMWQEDETLDDLCLAINLKDKGLVVITGCAHTGVINSIKHMQKVTGVEKVYAVIGGFHLGFPGVADENILKTVDEIKKLNPKIVSPMHCSGFKTMCAFQREMPEAFLLNTVGTRVEL